MTVRKYRALSPEPAAAEFVQASARETPHQSQRTDPQITWISRSVAVPEQLRQALAFVDSIDSPDPATAAVQRILRARFANIGGPSLDDLFGLRPKPGERSVLTIMAQAWRDRLISELAADHHHVPDAAWKTAEGVAHRLKAFAGEQWPRWKSLADPPTSDAAERLCFLIFKTGESLKTPPPTSCQGVLNAMNRAASQQPSIAQLS